MLRNLPNNYTREMLLKHIDDKGFSGSYDFFYLPIDFNSQACLGYAFINLCSPEHASALMAAFEGFGEWVIPTRKRCMVSWSDPHQGFQSNVERYKNSPVMHKDVPDGFKPCVFDKLGSRSCFPSPTKRVRCPRLRVHGNDWQSARSARSQRGNQSLPLVAAC
jgi:protein phosphatase 1 regulatory subunit 42